MYLRENLVALVGASLTSQVIKVTPILPEILTSCPYNCWPLLLRMSVLYSQIATVNYFEAAISNIL